jgi:hypothetical protein
VVLVYQGFIHTSVHIEDLASKQQQQKNEPLAVKQVTRKNRPSFTSNKRQGQRLGFTSNDTNGTRQRSQRGARASSNRAPPSRGRRPQPSSPLKETKATIQVTILISVSISNLIT